VSSRSKTVAVTVVFWKKLLWDVMLAVLDASEQSFVGVLSKLGRGHCCHTSRAERLEKGAANTSSKRTTKLSCFVFAITCVFCIYVCYMFTGLILLILSICRATVVNKDEYAMLARAMSMTCIKPEDLP